MFVLKYRVYKVGFHTFGILNVIRLSDTYTRILRAALNISWNEHPTIKRLYDHLPNAITTIRERRMRFSGHCWRHKEELVADTFLWQPQTRNDLHRTPSEDLRWPTTRGHWAGDGRPVDGDDMKVCTHFWDSTDHQQSQ